MSRLPKYERQEPPMTATTRFRLAQFCDADFDPMRQFAPTPSGQALPSVRPLCDEWAIVEADEDDSGF